MAIRVQNVEKYFSEDKSIRQFIEEVIKPLNERKNFFSSYTFSDDSSSHSLGVWCNGKDGEPIMFMTEGLFSIVIASSESTLATSFSELFNYPVTHLFECDNGCVFISRKTSSTKCDIRSIWLTKTNTDDTMIISIAEPTVAVPQQSSIDLGLGTIIFAEGDDNYIGNTGVKIYPDGKQTLLQPIDSYGSILGPKYASKCFFIPISQSRRQMDQTVYPYITTMELDGNTFLTDGYIALLDE